MLSSILLKVYVQVVSALKRYNKVFQAGKLLLTQLTCGQSDPNCNVSSYSSWVSLKGQFVNFWPVVYMLVQLSYTCFIVTILHTSLSLSWNCWHCRTPSRSDRLHDNHCHYLDWHKKNTKITRLNPNFRRPASWCKKWLQ